MKLKQQYSKSSNVIVLLGTATRAVETTAIASAASATITRGATAVYSTYNKSSSDNINSRISKSSSNNKLLTCQASSRPIWSGPSGSEESAGQVLGAVAVGRKESSEVKGVTREAPTQAEGATTRGRANLKHGEVVTLESPPRP